MTRLIGPLTYVLGEIAEGIHEVYLNPKELADALNRAGYTEAAGIVLLVTAHVENQLEARE